MNTGEDTQGLRKILDMTRLISLVILNMHIYIYGYQAFREWGLSTLITDRLFFNFAKLEMFRHPILTKAVVLLFLGISLIGAKGKKSEELKLKPILLRLGISLTVYFSSGFCFLFNLSADVFVCFYLLFLGIGYLLLLKSGTELSRLIKESIQKDIFNSENETFPQEERLLENEYSFNLPTKYHLKGEVRDGWINCVNPFRSILVSGSGGAGKTYFVIRHIIDQHLRKGFSMFIYDFKFVRNEAV